MINNIQYIILCIEYIIILLTFSNYTMKNILLLKLSLCISLLCMFFTSCSKEDGKILNQSENVVEDFSQEGNMIFTDNAGEQTFSFTTSMPWTIKVASTRNEGATWCSVVPTSGEAGTHIVKITTLPNESYDDRSVTITLNAGTESKSFVVTQKQKNALLLTSDKFELDQKGGDITVEVKSNVNYTATISESCKDWIKENDATRALSTSTKSYNISLNDSGEKREGNIIFSDGTLTETVHVYQSSGPVILLSKNDYYVGASGEDIMVELRSNCDYEVVMPSVDWIKEVLSRSMSSHTLYYTVSANETYDAREAKIIYRDKGNNDIADTLTIRQAQKDAIIVSEKEVKVDYKGGTVEVKIDANVDFEMQLPSVDWIGETPSRALITHTKFLTIAENTSNSPRTANVIFKNTTSGIEETLVISQSTKGKKVKVHVEKPGTLSDLIPESEKMTIEELEVSGYLGGLDIAFIREMAGRSRENESITDGKLVYLDMTNANIVADGEPYLSYTSSGEIYLPEENVIGYKMFFKSSLISVLLPKSITEIDMNAFSYSLNLSKIGFQENSVIKIGGQAFFNCSSLSNVILPEGLMEIGHSAFSGCKNLSNIKLPNSLSIIGDFAFSDCDGLSIIIPNNVNLIGGLVFAGNNLDITIPGRFMDTLISPISNTCENLHVTIADGTTEIGAYAFQKMPGLVSISIPNSVKSIGQAAFWQCSGLAQVIIPNSVNTIDNNVFSECTGLTSVVLSNNLNSMGTGVFSGCTNLSTINIPENITVINDATFSGCKSLVNMILPDHITAIGNNAFNSCDNLTIRIPKGTSSIGQGAFNNIKGLNIALPGKFLSDSKYSLFNNCKELKITMIDDGSTIIGEGVFAGCVGLVEICMSDAISSIKSHAFYGCTNLKKIIIPDKVTSIEERTFYQCTSLDNVYIPNNVTSIDNEAFYGCTSLKSVTIPSKMSLIKKGTFEKCASLEYVTIPDGVTTIESAAFAYCTTLSSIVIPNSVSEIGDAFYGCTNLSDITIPSRLYTSSVFRGTGITNIVIPKGVIKLGDFSDCTKLESVIMPDDVESLVSFSGCSSLRNIKLSENLSVINDGLFSGCINLTEVTIPEKATSIGRIAFHECRSLTNISIPDGVKTIGDYAFSECSNLVDVTLGRSVNFIDQNAFYNVPIKRMYCKTVFPPNMAKVSGIFPPFSVELVRKTAVLYVPVGTSVMYSESDWGTVFENIVEL